MRGLYVAAFLAAVSAFGQDVYYTGFAGGTLLNGSSWSSGSRTSDTENLFIGYAPGTLLNADDPALTMNSGYLSAGNLTTRTNLHFQNSIIGTDGAHWSTNFGAKIVSSASEFRMFRSSDWRTEIESTQSNPTLLIFGQANSRWRFLEGSSLRGTFNVVGARTNQFVNRGSILGSLSSSGNQVHNSGIIDGTIDFSAQDDIWNSGTMILSGISRITSDAGFRNTGRIVVTGYKSRLTLSGRTNVASIESIEIQPGAKVALSNAEIDATGRNLDLEALGSSVQVGDIKISGGMVSMPSSAHSGTFSSLTFENVLVTGQTNILVPVSLEAGTRFGPQQVRLQNTVFWSRNFILRDSLNVAGNVVYGNPKIGPGGHLKLEANSSMNGAVDVDGGHLEIVSGTSLIPKIRLNSGRVTLGDRVNDCELIAYGGEVGVGTNGTGALFGLLHMKRALLYVGPNQHLALGNLFIENQAATYIKLYANHLNDSVISANEACWIGGHLIVRRDSSFATHPGQEFTLISSSDLIKGTFFSTDIPSHWQIIYEPRAVKLRINQRLTAVPEPGSFLVLAAGLGVVVRRKSRPT